MRLSRRTLLRGVGTAIALPWLEAMGRDRCAWAVRRWVAPCPGAWRFSTCPTACICRTGSPKKPGSQLHVPATLQPLAPYQDDLLVLTGLAQHNAEALGDGPGDHARSLASFLTGAHPLKTDGAGIRVGVSVDQVAAQKIGRQTRLPSLELGIERGAQSGNCDSGYSCAYSSNISWRSANMPMAKEINPRLVFDRLFPPRPQPGARRPSERKRELYQKSILDLVLGRCAAASQPAGRRTIGARSMNT